MLFQLTVEAFTDRDGTWQRRGWNVFGPLKGLRQGDYMPPAKGAPEGGDAKGSSMFLYRYATKPPTN